MVRTLANFLDLYPHCFLKPVSKANNIGLCFQMRGKRATKPLKIMYYNVRGPMRTTFIGGARYFVTFINYFSNDVWLYVLKSKWTCFEKFKEFKALVETQSEHKIKMFWSDNGGEFVSKTFNHFLWYRKANVYLIYASIKWNSKECESYHRRDSKEHASCSKPRQIILGRNGG